MYQLSEYKMHNHKTSKMQPVTFRDTTLEKIVSKGLIQAFDLALNMDNSKEPTEKVMQDVFYDSYLYPKSKVQTNILRNFLIGLRKELQDSANAYAFSPLGEYALYYILSSAFCRTLNIVNHHVSAPEPYKTLLKEFGVYETDHYLIPNAICYDFLLQSPLSEDEKKYVFKYVDHLPEVAFDSCVYTKERVRASIILRCICPVLNISEIHASDVKTVETPQLIFSDDNFDYLDDTPEYFDLQIVGGQPITGSYKTVISM